MLTEILTQNLNIIYLIYGLSFFTMGVAIFAKPRVDSVFELSYIIRLLAVFGLTHGIREWLRAVTLFGIKNTSFDLLEIAFLVVSYIFLFEFGRRFILLSFNFKRLLGIWLTVALAFLAVALIFIERQEKIIWARYFLGFPGGILAGCGFLCYYRKHADTLEAFNVRLYFLSAAVSMGFYGILGGIVVPKASFFPASFINNESFLSLFGIPVQVFRAICAISLTWAIWNILTIFDLESKATLNRRTEEANAATSYARSILETMTCSLVVLDLDGKITTVNKAACELLGYKEEELIGKPAREIFEDDRVTKGATLKNFPLIYCSKEKGLIPTLSSCSPLKNGKGKTGGIICVGKDMSEIKELREKLTNSEKLALMGRFSGIIGHELKNQLSVMRNAVYFLKMKLEGKDEKIKQYFDMLEKEIMETDRVVENILTFARTKKLELKSADLKNLLPASINNVKIPEKIKISTQIEEGLPAIQADEMQLNRLFVNIILNAVQAMANEGILTIKASGAGDFIKVSFEDTGPGIKEEDKEKLFEPFFSTKISGTGLGLAISKIITEAHGGTIGIESEAGKGTTVTIRLPRRGKG